MRSSLPRTANILIVGALVLSAGSCSGGDTDNPSTTPQQSADAQLPEREPDVTGVVGDGAPHRKSPFLDEPSDDYYLGMYLLPGEPLLIGGDGETLSASSLTSGVPVSVWVGDACAESFPVQCEIVAIEVTGDDG